MAEKSNELYTYGDYLKWHDDERWELINGAAYILHRAADIKIYQASYSGNLPRIARRHIPLPCSNGELIIYTVEKLLEPQIHADERSQK